MKPSVSGVSHVGKWTPMNDAVAVLAVVRSGIWMRSFSPFVAKATPSGERWISMGMCLICGSQSRRNKQAAKRFFDQLLKGLQDVPRVIIPDKLKSYGAAKREILPGVEHRQHKGLHNRAENAHQPTRLREKNMRRFKSAKQAQRFLSADRAALGTFPTAKTRISRAGEDRAIFQTRFPIWNEVTATNTAAEHCIVHSSSSPSSFFFTSSSILSIS